jgi:hypothetical protein
MAGVKKETLLAAQSCRLWGAQGNILGGGPAPPSHWANNRDNTHQANPPTPRDYRSEAQALLGMAERGIPESIPSGFRG